MSNKFENGEVVILVGIRGPDMVVTNANVGFAGEVLCQWFDKTDRLQEAAFNPDRLQLLYPSRKVKAPEPDHAPFIIPMDPNMRFEGEPIPPAIPFAQADVPVKLRTFGSFNEIGDVARDRPQTPVLNTDGDG